MNDIYFDITNNLRILTVILGPITLVPNLEDLEMNAPNTAKELGFNGTSILFLLFFLWKVDLPWDFQTKRN